MGKVVFIEGNTTGTARRLAELALARGLDVAFLTATPERYPYLDALLVRPIPADTADREAVLARVAGLGGVEAVMSTSDAFVETAAWVAEQLRLPAADWRAIRLCRDKARAAAQLLELGVAVPRTSVLPPHGTTLPDGFAFPVVVKPNTGTGSAGVRLAADAGALREHIERLRASPQHRGDILVQEFVDGPEYSLETMGDGSRIVSLGVTRKMVSAPPCFVELGHDFPDAASGCDVGGLIEALRSLGLGFGPAHSEFRVRDGRPVVLEVNPRLAGGMIPVLIAEAGGTDPLALWLDLALGREVALPHAGAAGFAAIRFLVPPAEGVIRTQPAPSRREGIVDSRLYKAAGEAVRLQGDFRDRIGHVIARGATAADAGLRADAALVDLAAATQVVPAGDGAPAVGVDPILVEILRKPVPEARLRRELAEIAAVDQAHLLMLLKQGLLPDAQVRSILSEVAALEAACFAPLLDLPMPRGAYLAYEGFLIERLGIEVAGNAHLGRSRNDMNAALLKRRLRGDMSAGLASIWRLLRVTLDRAERYAATEMPIYSQYQPALPGTYGFYLHAVARFLFRSGDEMIALLADLDESPLGAGAGCGTDVAIDQLYASDLLGFASVNPNALDAVANRDSALRFAAALANLAVNVSRVAQDFQVWLMRELGFFALPDQLVGGSSMMPQKRNPWVLEAIKGKATRVAGAHAAVAAGMLKTPYGNSYEVGTEALAGLEAAAADGREALDLLRLVIDRAVPITEAMAKSAQAGRVAATQVANALHRDRGLSFRAAYDEVRAAVGGEAGAWPALVSAVGLPADGRGLTVRLQHGGGPGPAGLAAMQAEAAERIDRLGAAARAAHGRWAAAEVRRRMLVRSVCASS